MLIGLDAIPLTEPRAGVGHYTFELARALSLASGRDEFELLYPSSYEQIELDEEGLPRNLRAVRVGVGAVGRRWFAVGLPRYLRRKQVPLFHGTNYEVPLWGGAARVVTIHDLSLLLHPETHEGRRVKRARLRQPLMARAADAVITPTESVRREVCEHFGVAPSKVFAVAEAARECFAPMEFGETEEVRRRLGAGREFLLAVGTLEPRKNLRVALGAFEEVLRARPRDEGLRLVVAGGRGWMSEPFTEALEKSPARARVVLAGYVSDEDLRALYSSCRAFLYLSLYEGFGLPPLEAMKCGAAVVAGRTSAVAEVTGGAARLVSPDSPEEAAAATLELLEVEPARRALAEAGLRRASEFSWPRAARETLAVYEEVLNKQTRER
ncbi:MAG TPA: glycosyltransferase family 1 protein [Pyrinomonadaceae bacterium]|nr:glycosyltransferase family 1 protein [Pyrinomonadaceae bacterium]